MSNVSVAIVEMSDRTEEFRGYAKAAVREGFVTFEWANGECITIPKHNIKMITEFTEVSE